MQDRTNRLPIPMPLPPPPVSRQRLHVRRMEFEGFQREDGLFDIEARLSDVKDHDYTLMTGQRPAGDAIHDLWARVTIDRSFDIRAVATSTERMPYPGACQRINPAYARLVGTNLLRGFRMTLYELMGGVQGCTHLTELIAAIPTAALQTFAGLRREIEPGEDKPFQLDRCHALEQSTETVREFYPTWYRGAT